MKLPNFYINFRLNDLRRRMGISETQFGVVETKVDPSRLTEEQLEKLISGEGIDVEFKDLTILPDGTFAYKDRRVLVYIRDVHVMGGRSFEPRYHFMTCSTIEDMRQKKRIERYVANSQLDGLFQINLISKEKVTPESRRLNVCQNCLSGLAFDGFNHGMASTRKRAIVNSFTPEVFFKVYPAGLHHITPEYSWENSPIDDYTSDFPDVSRRMRAAGGWRCQACSIDLSADAHRRFLHVHHVGPRRDNSPANLKILCIECHSKEANHAHLRANPDFRRFQKLFGRA